MIWLVIVSVAVNLMMMAVLNGHPKRPEIYRAIDLMQHRHIQTYDQQHHMRTPLWKTFVKLRCHLA